MADRARLSPAVFARRCRDVTGLPPYRWLSLARVERAKELLERTEMPVGAIARRCGFHSTSAFGDRFRREVGLHPHRYRDEHCCD